MDSDNSGAHIIRRPGDPNTFVCARCGEADLFIRLLTDSEPLESSRVPVGGVRIECSTCGNYVDHVIGTKGDAYKIWYVLEGADG